MSNQTVEVVDSGSDKLKIALAFAVFIAGIVGYYLLEKQPMIARVASVLAGIGAAVAIGWFSASGQRLFAFGKDSWSEAKRVVWPTRAETMKMTGIVFAFVIIVAIFLFATDKFLEWVLYDLLLGWRK
jgi:preprotein translocase subunit SecE